MVVDLERSDAQGRPLSIPLNWAYGVANTVEEDAVPVLEQEEEQVGQARMPARNSCNADFLPERRHRSDEDDDEDQDTQRGPMPQQ